MEQVEKQTENPDRATLKDKYRAQAIADLGESFKQGFNDYDWAAKDPDFKFLRGDPDFKKIIDGNTTDNKKSDDKEEDGT